LAVSEVLETGAAATHAFGMIERALKQAGLEREQIECLAIGLGPGSYTGVRAAIAAAQGWSLARKVGVFGLSSANAIAAQAWSEGVLGEVAVVIDAQRGEFYLAGYSLGPEGWEETSPLRLASRAEVHQRESAGSLLLGPELPKWFGSGRVVFPRAATLGQMGLSQKAPVEPEKLEPIYLRETRFIKAPPPRVLPP